MSSFFGKVGSFLRENSGSIADIGNQLAAAGGNFAPLQIAHQAKVDALQQKLGQSQLETATANRRLLQLQGDNYQAPEQTAQQTVNVKRAETPTTYQTDDNQTGIADTDLRGHTTPRMVHVANPEIGLDRERTTDFNRNFPGGEVSTPPPTMPSTVPRPAIMPQTVGFHVQDPVTGTIYEYGKSGAAIGTQPGPPNPNVPLIPGMGKVNAIDAGAANALPPNPRDYPQGARDAKFRTDYQTFLKSASDAKQANALAAAGARGAAFNATKPITTLDNEGQDIISTLGDERKAGRGTPEHPILAGNQSGAAGLGQKRATFAEVDKNLAGVRQYLPSLTNDMGSRAAFAAVLTPGTGILSNLTEATGLKHLTPDQQNLVFAIRNLRQGATSLKNVLSSNGVSDKRVAILESELPNEADLMTGDPGTVERKLATFDAVYKEVAAAYPQLMSKGRAGIAPPAGPLTPPTKPTANRVIQYDAQGNRLN